MLFAALLSVGAPHLRTTNNDNNRPKICKKICVYSLFFKRTGLRMMCSPGLGILLKEESFIFLDLVHQRKKTTMLFVR